MVQAAPRFVFNPSGKENIGVDSAIVSIAPQLPLYVEVRTSSLTSFLLKIYNFDNRKAILSWLSSKQKTGYYFEISEDFHLGYADQRDGKGSEHWWIIYYKESVKKIILENIKIQEHSVDTKVKNNQFKEELIWNGLIFRSQTEKRIAKALYSKNIIFFANANGFMALNGLPVANHDNKLREKAEVDFLVFHNQKCMILEVDGKHHNEDFQRNCDYKRDRIFLRQGISTVRFSAEQCYENTSAVIEEFLELFGV